METHSSEITLDALFEAAKADTCVQIVKTFGFDTMTTYLVQAPPYAIAYISACLIAYSSGRFQESFWHIVIPIVLSAVGCSVLIGTLNVGARYFGIILLISGTVSFTPSSQQHSNFGS